jgi:tetratricopeptide (TPR) repeat protein
MAQSDEQQGKPTGGGGREPSDRWDFSSVPPASGDLIPQLKEIPETPEERRRRRIILTVSAIAAGIALVVAVIIALHLRHRAQIDDAVAEAEGTGRAGALERAMALLEGEDGAEDRAVLARMHAVAHLEHARAASKEQAQALLQALGEPPPGGAVVASVYLALAEGAMTEAHQLATQLQPRGDHKAEALRAQALAAEAVGAAPQALPLAQAALEQRSGSPRHAALVLRLAARLGQDDAAGAALEGLDEAERASPAIRIAQARVALQGGEPAKAAEHARGVPEDGTATAVEQAWARLVLAHAAVHGGDAKGALDQAEAATEGRPPGDEDFILVRGRTLLLAGAVGEAGTELERLPPGVTRSPGLRAHVVAELALARGQASAAEEALARAPEGPRTALLRGHAARARRKASEARALYKKAAEAEPVRAEALAALALLELAEGNGGAAVEAASKALTEAPKDAAAVQAFVRAKVARTTRVRP